MIFNGYRAKSIVSFCEGLWIDLTELKVFRKATCEPQIAWFLTDLMETYNVTEENLIKSIDMSLVTGQSISDCGFRYPKLAIGENTWKKFCKDLCKRVDIPENSCQVVATATATFSAVCYKGSIPFKGDKYSDQLFNYLCDIDKGCGVSAFGGKVVPLNAVMSLVSSNIMIRLQELGVKKESNTTLSETLGDIEDFKKDIYKLFGLLKNERLIPANYRDLVDSSVAIVITAGALNFARRIKIAVNQYSKLTGTAKMLLFMMCRLSLMLPYETEVDIGENYRALIHYKGISSLNDDRIQNLVKIFIGTEYLSRRPKV